MGESLKRFTSIFLKMYKLYDLLFDIELQKCPFGTYMNVHLAKFGNFIITYLLPTCFSFLS